MWDLDGREFLDCSIGGVSTSPLGFADADVEAAVIEAVKAGPMSTLNCPRTQTSRWLMIWKHIHKPRS